MLFLRFASLIALLGISRAFDLKKNTNLAAYWGQNAGGDQGQFAAYCNDDTIDTLVMGFINSFNSTGPSNQPVINLSNICTAGPNNTFPGTGLADCSFLSDQIKACQKKGKAVTISLGGANSAIGFTDEDDARSFGDLIYNEFLGGNGELRPFGKAVLDGIDLDIEGGSPDHYAAFINRVKSRAAAAKQRVLITGAPQCPFPDVNMNEMLKTAPFDAVYVQFYNNPGCELNNTEGFNFNVWDEFARNGSKNPDLKVYLGAPASSKAATTGILGMDDMQSLITSTQVKFKSFGGVMLFDVSAARDNNDYDKGVKLALTGKVTAKQTDSDSKISVSSSSSAQPTNSTSSTTPVTATDSAIPTSSHLSAPTSADFVLTDESADGNGEQSLGERGMPKVMSRHFRLLRKSAFEATV
ncbi:glycoside hydrolase [Dentipellis sp. KUC8613]|nr:glycoside hydrolase [Dentipellis sp. KUC8613]